MTTTPQGRPTSSQPRPKTGDDLTQGWSSGRPLPPGTTTTVASTDDHHETTRSSQPNGTTTTTTPQLPGHAPGWKWRKDVAGSLTHPWAFDLPAHAGGLCELGWHTDCPQRLLTTEAGAGQCSCPCHQAHDRA
jgi:hypothetical protein